MLFVVFLTIANVLVLGIVYYPFLVCMTCRRFLIMNIVGVIYLIPWWALFRLIFKNGRVKDLIFVQITIKMHSLLVRIFWFALEYSQCTPIDQDEVTVCFFIVLCLMIISYQNILVEKCYVKRHLILLSKTAGISELQRRLCNWNKMRILKSRQY